MHLCAEAWADRILLALGEFCAWFCFLFCLEFLFSFRGSTPNAVFSLFHCVRVTILGVAFNTQNAGLQHLNDDFCTELYIMRVWCNIFFRNVKLIVLQVFMIIAERRKKHDVVWINEHIHKWRRYYHQYTRVY